MENKNIKRCRNCVLPETFPGIKFNKDGVCQYCVNFAGRNNLEEKKQKYRRKFEKLIKTYKGKGPYDALVSYSGGKDSTYVLYLLKERYNLNILGVTFDNGFLPEQTHKNIRNIAESLGIDHVFFKPRFDVLKKIFIESSKKNIFSPKTITRASTICTACIAIIKFSSLRMAIEKNIPFVVFGWSPGQIPITSSIMKNNPQLLKPMQKALFDPLYDLVGKEIEPYFLDERLFTDSSFFPYNVDPLGFLDYNEKELFKRVNQLGWKQPEELDAHSTNCLLNSFANIVHKKKYHFHPYVFELAKLVREDYLERSEAIEKLNQDENPETVHKVEEKLKIQV